MKLLELDIKGFGLLSNQHIRFHDGINIIYGRNEAGKSTIHTFIKAMIYGMERSRGIASLTDTWSRYEPWVDKGCYEGKMKFEYNGDIYTIERSFVKDAKEPLVIFNETKGVHVDSYDEFLDKVMCGLTESGFVNTISIGQLKSAGDEGMRKELRRYISNMNNTANMQIDTSKAINYLQDQKKSFSEQIVPEAAKSYTSNLSEIRSLENDISSPEYGEKLTTIKEKTSTTQKQTEELQAKKESLIEKISCTKQNLLNFGFSNKEELDTFKEEYEIASKEYRSAVEKEMPRSLRLLGLLFNILGVAFAVFAIYMIFVGEHNLLSRALGIVYGVAVAVSIAVSMISFLIAYYLSTKIGFGSKELSTAQEILTDMYREKLGDGEISDENAEKMEEHLRSCYEMFDTTTSGEQEISFITEEIKKLNEERDDITKSLEEHQISQWELEKQLEHLGNLKDETAALKKVIMENDRLQFEIDAINIAQDIIHQLSQSIKTSFGTYLNKEASVLVSGITGGVYDSMFIDDDLNIFMNTRTKLIPIEQISRGTMDQIYLALRLAVAGLIAEDGETLPLLFDDSFANYDEKRLRSALRWLNQNYKQKQILLFSCHKREAQMLTSQLIDFNLIDLA